MQLQLSLKDYFKIIGALAHAEEALGLVHKTAPELLGGGSDLVKEAWAYCQESLDLLNSLKEADEAYKRLLDGDLSD
jgi:hypothetical protein